MERINNEPAEGVESGGPLSKLGDAVLPMGLGELPVCVNVRPLPRSDGYNHAVMVANTTIKGMVIDEIERALQRLLNGASTYQNTEPTQDPHGLDGIQYHQLMRPIYIDSESESAIVLKPEKKSLKTVLRSLARRMKP